MTDLSRWNDDRLDDLALNVRSNSEQLRAVSDIRTGLSELRGGLKNVEEDSLQCISELRQLKKDLETRAETQHRERKADRKWMVATALATASIIIAALAAFLG